VINVVTVHWHTSKWVDAQLRYLDLHVDAPYRVFAALNGIDDPALWQRFFFAEDLPGSHAQKLNALADVVARQSAPTDVLVFLDGDAFPIAALVPWIVDTLAAVPLVAIRRAENLGDRQPHPSFCATTVGFWEQIGGDWRTEAWTNAAGREVVDVGGRLLHALEERGIEWLPLLRSNTYNPHPLWFGVYGHRIYHHGAGFQAARAERVDWAERYRRRPQTGRRLRPTEESPSLGTLRARFAAGELRLADVRPRHLPVVGRAALKTLRLRREHRYFRRQASSERGRHLREMSDRVFSELSSDPAFYLQFDDVAPGTGPAPAG
jgi:hypothetical protein